MIEALVPTGDRVGHRHRTVMDEAGIVSQLPHLLRYARALTLSDSEGEALVEATLRSLLDRETSLDPGVSVAMVLFERLHRNWIALDVAHDAAGGHDECLYGALSRASPEERAALLLVRFEGFSEAEAAAVTRCTEAELSRRLISAERRVFRLARPRLLIIEGEGRNGIVDWDGLGREVDCELAGPVSFEDAVAAAGHEEPDAVLASPAAGCPAAQTARLERICARRGVPLVMLAEAPKCLAETRGLDHGVVVTPPYAPAEVAAATRHALQRVRLTPPPEASRRGTDET